MSSDLLIIGAGPAGLAAAIAAGRNGQHVVICERMSRPGLKLLATGGGRCNITTSDKPEVIAQHFGKHGRFMLPALESFGPAQIRAFFDSCGVPTLVQPDGCVFPVSQKATDILQALLQAAREVNVDIKCGCEACELLSDNNIITGIKTSGGDLTAGHVILASGGCSYPTLGSNGTGFSIAQRVGLKIETPLPALTSLATTATWPYELAGITLMNGRAWVALPRAPRLQFDGPILFTYTGLSGPPILNLSGTVAAELVRNEATIYLQLIAGRDRQAWQQIFLIWRQKYGGRALHNLLSGEMPRRLAEAICAATGTMGLAIARAAKLQLDDLATYCGELPLQISATGNWQNAMVTRGGISLKELEPATLKCRRFNGLKCVGEVVNLDGPCGGYNLTWALASGWLAGKTL